MRTVDTHTDVGGVFQAVILPTSSPFSSAVSQICTENSRFSHCPLTRPAATLSPGGDERVKSTISTLPSPPSGQREDVKKSGGRDSRHDVNPASNCLMMLGDEFA